MIDKKMPYFCENCKETKGDGYLNQGCVIKVEKTVDDDGEIIEKIII